MTFLYNGPILTIDLNSIGFNYNYIQKNHNNSIIATVIKSDSYKLGEFIIPKFLEEIGCQNFYVANLDEGISLRNCLGSMPTIYILYGVEKDYSNLYIKHNLIPVLNTKAEILHWSAYSENLQSIGASNKKSAAAIKINTGMNRLGVTEIDIIDLQKHSSLDYLDIKSVMTHLACGRVTNKKNDDQLNLFQKIANTYFPNTPKSIAASNILTLSDDFALSIIRIGSNLYGMFSKDHLLENPLQFALKVEAKILQILTVKEGETIGYTDKYIAKTNMTLATIAIGYADGLPLSAGSGNFSVKINGALCPIVGEISMNLTSIDITGIYTTDINESTWVTIVENNSDLDVLAKASNSSQHELITRFGMIKNKKYIRQ